LAKRKIRSKTCKTRFSCWTHFQSHKSSVCNVKVYNPTLKCTVVHGVAYVLVSRAS